MSPTALTQFPPSESKKRTMIFSVADVNRHAENEAVYLEDLNGALNTLRHIGKNFSIQMVYEH